MKKLLINYSWGLSRINPLMILFLAILIIMAMLGLAGCANTTTTTATTIAPGGPGGGTIINSDSIINAKIQAIFQQTSGYPFELDILVQSSENVGTLPNPTQDSVGKVITVKTDEDISKFKVNDLVAAKVKYVGDVPKPGISLYIYNITPQK
jgi:hypothetical protein